LQKLRERLRQMCDEELFAFGKQVRTLSGPRVGVTPDPREEWQSRGVLAVPAEPSKSKTSESPCTAATVCGVTMTNAERQSRHIRDGEAQKRRSIAVISRGFLQRALKPADLMAQSQILQLKVNT